jgi:hypothetical protein
MRSLWIAIAVVGATVTPANAAVTRYALVFGNDAGDRDEARLRYAERDADRFAGVLGDLGGFAPANITILHGADADTTRAALIALNDRIRTNGPNESMLVVYYSGHADADALHLGTSTLPLPQLEQLVRGSSATFRLLILDSCRSGALTRVKGGQAGPAFPIVLGDTLSADGVVFWTASAASEDAQESDDIRGSFFTHYLVSGLVGPADFDGDGRVTISEAYDYARVATLRASSRTLAGTQHPTYRDETRGRVDVALTTPGANTGRAILHAPAEREMLVFVGGADGAVVAEIGAHDRTRQVSLRPGRYFVRQRTERYLLEGAVTLAAGDNRSIDDAALDRVDYARLVRKGGRRRQDGVEVSFAIQTPVIDGGNPCVGGIAGYQIDTEWFAITPRIAACRETSRNSFVDQSTLHLATDLRVSHAWDVSRFSLGVQAQAGAAILRQSFSAMTAAPPRDVAAITFGGGAFAGTELWRAVSTRLAVEANTFVMRRDEVVASRWETTLALRVLVAVAVAF